MSVNPNEKRIKEMAAIELAKKGQPERGYIKKGEVKDFSIDLNGGIPEAELWSKYFGITVELQQEIFTQEPEEESPF